MSFVRIKFLQVILSFLFLFPTVFHGEEREVAVAEESLPRLPSKPSKEKTTPFIKATKAIILIGKTKDVLKGSELEDARGVQIIGVKLPANEKWLKRRLSPYIDQEASNETIDEIKEVITTFYKEFHHPFVLIQVPSQEITSGVLQFLILESHLGQVKVEGNKWTSSQRLINYTGLEPGVQIDEGELMNDVSFINRNPFRRVDIIYAPGARVRTTDVILAVKDRRPLRVYAGSENTGIEPIGRGRWYTGFNWGNAFGLDHILSYQFTSAFNVHRFHAHTADYLAPLSWKHVFNVFGGYSEVHPKVHKPMRRNRGWSMQASLRYTVPLKTYRYLEHEMTGGFDFKRTNNTFEFSEDLPQFGNIVNLSQLVLGYSGNYERNSFRLDFDGDVYWSPGELFADQKNSNYESLRPDAKNRWVYFRGSFVYLQRLPKSFSFSFLAKGQISSQNLLPSEQFGLGGYDTVRGYDQREVNKDGAILLSAEARSPALAVVKPWNDAVQFLVFLDYGWGDDHNAIPGQRKTDYLLGTGPGIRYTIEPYLTARLDWGIKLHKKANFGGGNTMIHFNVTASY